MNGPLGRGPVLVERTRELAALDDVLAAAAAGRGRLAIVEGAAGIGKSALLAAVRGTAAATGTTVLRARCTELEGDFAFGVVRQLFERPLLTLPAAARAEVLQGPARRAAEVVGLIDAPDATPASVANIDFAALHGLYWLVVNLAARGPLVLAVDDGHWADAPSLRFLAFLAPRLEELPVALVIAARTEVPEVARTPWDALAATTSALVIQPNPLSAEGVAELLTASLDQAPAASFAAACHSATGGTPFLVQELAVALQLAGVVPDEASADRVAAVGADTLHRWLLLRLARLSPAATQVARAVAVLEVAQVATAAGLAGLDVVAAGAAADELERAGILQATRPLMFAHPLARTAVYDGMGSTARAEAHRRAAPLVSEGTGGDERAARHLLRIEATGDPWAVRCLIAAADDAAARGAPESAATFLTRALKEPLPADQRVDILVRLGVAESAAGHPVGERHLRAALAEATDPALRTRVTLLLAHTAGRTERYEEAVALIETAATTLPPEAADTAAALEAMALTIGMLGVRTGPTLVPRLDAVRRRADDPSAGREILALAALRAIQANEPAAAGVGLALRALALGKRVVPRPDEPPWLAQASVALVWADAHDDAAFALDGGVAAGRAVGDTRLLAATLSHRAWLQLRRGDLRGAETDARTVLAPDWPAPPLYERLAQAILVNVLVEQGEVAAAAALATEAGEPQRSLTGATQRLARACVALAERRYAGALDDALMAGADQTACGVISPGPLAWRSTAALAHYGLGDTVSAQALADEEVELARVFGAHRTLGVALRAAGTVHRGAHGEALLREAIAELDAADVPLERGRAEVDLGALLRASTDAPSSEEARTLLRSALHIAHRAGAMPLADRAEAELRAGGARPQRAVLSGIDALTASERRVADLAARGLTNREIAQELYITPRTVEGHLTRAFNKLQIRSRETLAQALVAA